MSQSTKIIVALMFAFVIYTTMRGHLRNYLASYGTSLMPLAYYYLAFYFLLRRFAVINATVNNVRTYFSERLKDDFTGP
jgi:hypothetical protein